MPAEWDTLSDDLQLTLTQAAFCRAASTIAGHAELLADEIESGAITDLGGPDALRMFANLVRLSGRDPFPPQGRA